MVRKDENAKSESTSAERVLLGFRGCVVFDYRQAEGRDLPNIGTVKGDPLNYQDRLAEFVAGQGIALHYSADIAPARRVSEGGKITLLPGMSPAEKVSSRFHDLRHTFISRLAESQASDSTVMAFAGHASRAVDDLSGTDFCAGCG